MKQVTPSVQLIAETVLTGGFQEMLEDIGVPEWHTDGHSGTEVLVEGAGKLCYMSFSLDLNDNLTRVGTRSNFDYIQESLIKTQHGSVLEHGSVTFSFLNVSRVFTHELVRHRAGAAYSQTSGRFVRGGDLGVWLPTCIQDDPSLSAVFMAAFEAQEEALNAMIEISGINDLTKPSDFARKKELTSAFRRILGNGVATNIIATYNHRALRHLITQRTSCGAEEEIRQVFNQVFDLLVFRYPALYADHQVEVVGKHREITFASPKV